jgi:hypothetical protein
MSVTENMRQSPTPLTDRKFVYSDTGGQANMPVKLRHIMKYTLAGACAALFIFLDTPLLLALCNMPV